MKQSIYFLCLNAIQFVPYAYGTLRGYAEKTAAIRRQFAWEPPIWRMDPIDDIVSRIASPAVLLASCYVWNHNHHCEIARRVKEKYPSCRVIFGGPHVPLDNDDYFRQHPYVDALVHHEGEIPLEQLLRHVMDGTPALEDIEGITYPDRGATRHTGGSPRLPRPLPIPSPYLDGLFDDFLKNSTNARIGLLETNRGCPHSCTFCDWGVRTMNKIRIHEEDKVRAEIEYMAAHQVEDIYVVDCNFGLFKRDLAFAEHLVAVKKRTGYPKRVRIQFAKNSNDTVFKISKLLNENDMLWGTTLSMQSVDMDVLEAVNRPHLGMDAYRDLKELYSRHQIPTYTELILGLPLETRDSFVDGICGLFDIGIHDDIRVFELALLPNAPISRHKERKRYGLRTRIKPLRQVPPGGVQEDVELVVGTRSLPYDDWAYCLLFGEAIQALHNGGFTRFLAIYLNDRRAFSYRQFYDGFIQYLLDDGRRCGDGFRRVRQLIDQFHDDPHMSQIHRLMAQPDIVAFLDSYNPRRKGWQIWTYLWLWIAEHMEEFYEAVADFLVAAGLEMDAALDDLLRYQQSIMITLDYDPETGKQVNCDHNWHAYFFESGPLRMAPCTLHYRDRTMGVSHRFDLKAGDRIRFTRAAIGISYPYSKHLHFFHQPETTTVTGV